MRDLFEGKLYFAAACIIISFTLLLFLSTGCKSNNDTTKVQIKDGLIYKQGTDHPYTGRVLDTLENRIIEYDVVNGMKTGEFCLLSISGEFAVHGYLENNQNVGSWRYFYSNGQLESQGNFKNDQPHGNWNWYYENGKLKTIGYFIDGRAEGTWRSFDDNGLLTSVTFYQNGDVKSEVVVDKINSI